MTKIDRIKKILNQLEDLDTSPLYHFRIENLYKPVLGEGNLDAEIVFIGEAPGKNEAESGRPFCGRAGKILDELLNEAGLNRDEVYITNTVKDRPPNNRRPTKKEVEIYSPILQKQIEIIQPKILVTLGNTATDYIFEAFKVGEKYQNFGEVEGRVFPIKVNDQKALLYPLYHPAYAIYQRINFPKMREDFLQIQDLLRRINAPD